MLKGVDGFLEVIGGILLIFLNKNRLDRLVIALTQHELSEDPRDVVANFIVRLSLKISVSAQNFAIFYLISHGIIKFMIIVMLLRKKVWAYPVAILFLTLFIFYQVYRIFIKYSAWLLILTVFDVAIVILTSIEYRSKKLSVGFSGK